ncbi:cora-like Mg2+ transporter protein-domain-containing protein [Cercophora scortea]|uniref:Cora-like Mg2+ transporter protein-domain-containing protein n=1 Tax=Cercophora scortea TaxID=314031 RepID=A0AAE0MHB8_9PEZI|nr:cora-like Mg2+ transporter protein-domain-containing protein [Cercophora scortea]
MMASTNVTAFNLPTRGREFPHPRPFESSFIVITSQEPEWGFDISPLLPLPTLASKLSETANSEARLFVIETTGSDDELRGGAAGIPEDFIKAHLEAGDGLQSTMHEGTSTRERFFFATWARLVRQSKERFEDAERIRAKKPYDIETLKSWDPMDLLQNHRRHYKWPEAPSRPYDLVIEDVSGGGCKTLFHAAKECMSFSDDHSLYRKYGVTRNLTQSLDFAGADVFTGFLLVDPLQQHRVFEISYGYTEAEDTAVEKIVPCFLDDERPLERFREAFKRSMDDLEMGWTGSWTYEEFLNILVRVTITNLMCDDLSRVLGKISRSLDEIELVLHDNEILRHSVGRWRGQLGRWRNSLFHQDISVRYMSNNLKAIPTEELGGNDGLPGKMLAVEQDLQAIRRRIDDTFQALMSAMNIVESERAIMQAEIVSKLTHLAFFFVPLTLVATIFGMNVNEFSQHLPWWLWVLASILTTAVTYLALYWREFLSGSAYLFGLVKVQQVKSLRTLAVLKLESSMVMVFVAAAGNLAGLCVATWKLIASSSLSTGSKVAIGICAIWGPIIGLALFLCCRWTPTRGFHAAFGRRHRRSI